jgi:adenylosuccinate synthase
MKVDVLLGLQWGDEGKGKIVDVLSPNYDIIARFQGGPNAGHTLLFNGKKTVLHLLPSGIFRENTINIIGEGVVLDPVVFADEVYHIEKEGLNLKRNLYISEKTNLILPTHRVLDAAEEQELGKLKIGSTGKGIGPAYTDKISRNGLRVGDIFTSDFKEKYEILRGKHFKRLTSYDFDYDIKEYEEKWFYGIELIKQFQIVNGPKYFNDSIKSGKKILAEGAQGTLLDINAGTYPFVTSSTVTSSGVCTGLGISPHQIGEVYGIFKAYTTRVGSGPFPTELFDETGERIQSVGHEFGATTGRPRRCGWLDMVALKYAIQINGVTQLIMTKPDVLEGFETIKLSEKYETLNGIIDYFPYELNPFVKPVLRSMPSWKEELSGIKEKQELPIEFLDYLDYIESNTGIPIKIVSTGPDRNQTLFL